MLIPSLLKATVVAAPMFFSTFTPPPVRPEATRSVASAPLPTGYRSLASQSGVSTEKLLEMRKTLDRTAKISKRKEKAVEMRRLLLATLEANTQAEYNAIMTKLRDKLAAHKKSRLYGKFLVADNPSQAKGQRRSSGPASREECTTEEEGVTYTDECLTEQERADNAVWAEALYAETIYDFEESSDECQANSSDPINECDWAQSPSPSPALLTSARVYQSQSPFMAEGDGGDSACEPGEVRLEGVGGPASCVDQAYRATLAAAAWGAACANFFGKYANTVWSAARNAGNASRVALLVGALGVGYMIGSYINCVNGWEMLDSNEVFDRVYPNKDPLYSFIL
jgi:hypothetical protein